MIKALNRVKGLNNETIENLRDTMMDGLGTAWKAAKRMEVRSPLVYRQPPAARAGGWIGLALLSIAALAAGAWLYMRKRKQVADRFTIGEGPAAEWPSGRVPAEGGAVGTG